MTLLKEPLTYIREAVSFQHATEISKPYGEIELILDLVIPRGSASLIRMVVDEATVPTIETGAEIGRASCRERVSSPV